MKNLLLNVGKKSRKALSNELDAKKKDKVLKDYYLLIHRNKKLILSENKKDIKNALEKKLKDNLIKRLILNDKKIADITN
jgi:glutamate-5-semialdehyde dehydrogenase